MNRKIFVFIAVLGLVGILGGILVVGPTIVIPTPGDNNTNQNVEPLHYAVSDAKSVKSMFIEKYGFKKENIKVILEPIN